LEPSKVFLHAEFQVSMPFEEIDWGPINEQMNLYPGLRSKTWLSGVSNNSVGGFYEFDSIANAQNYIDKLLVPVTKQLGGNLSVRLYNGDVVEEASRGMDSPFYS